MLERLGLGRVCSGRKKDDSEARNHKNLELCIQVLSEQLQTELGRNPRPYRT